MRDIIEANATICPYSATNPDSDRLMIKINGKKQSYSMYVSRGSFKTLVKFYRQAAKEALEES